MCNFLDGHFARNRNDGGFSRSYSALPPENAGQAVGDRDYGGFDTMRTAMDAFNDATANPPFSPTKPP